MEPTNSQILQAINGLVAETQETMSELKNELKADIAHLKFEVNKMHLDISSVKSAQFDLLEVSNEVSTAIEKRFVSIEEILNDIKGKIATQSYIDGKLGLVHGRVVELIRKEGERVSTLIGALREKDHLDDSDVHLLETLKPLASV